LTSRRKWLDARKDISNLRMMKVGWLTLSKQIL
jgi:hypothetical protein